MPEGVGTPYPSGPDFDALYRTDPDPWKVATSWYERRKSDVLLATLPHERYRRCWEPACGPGVTSARLLDRVEDLVASDASEVAVTLAEERLRDVPGRHAVTLSALPGSPLAAPVDLVVVAECLYYLPDPAPALGTIWRAAAPGAHLVFLHWQGAPHDTRLSGPQVHDAVATFAAQRATARLVTVRDVGFLLDVYEVSS